MKHLEKTDMGLNLFCPIYKVPFPTIIRNTCLKDGLHALARRSL